MDYDNELIADFLGEYSDAQIEAEKILKQWDESDTSDDALFRIAHSIKSNFRMMELVVLSDTIHVLEDLLTQLRENKRHLIPGFTLLISITLEQCKELSKQIFKGYDKDNKIDILTNALIDLTQSSNSDFSSSLLKTLHILDELGEYGNDYSTQRLIDFFLHHEETNDVVTNNPYPNDPSIKQQLAYFKQLIIQIESFFPFWLNRSHRILTLLSHMNELLDNPVDPVQLEAAVFLHDIGMSFIPPQKIYVSRALAEEDRNLMQSHCEMGFNWLKIIPGWEDAAIMIRQHHERYDGTGYPFGLSSSEICDGAKLLAIGDTYASITNQEKEESQKKSIMFALMEIDQGAGHQFDPKWVKVFNQVIEMLDL